MKKLLVLLLAVLLAFCGVATAELDYSSMTDDELHAAINAARNELVRRELIAAKDVVIVDQDGVQMYMTGNNEVNVLDNGDAWLYIEFVVVNDADISINLLVEQSTVNGWDVHGDGMGATSAGAKQKVRMRMKVSDGEVTSLEEIEDIVVAYTLFDSDNSKTIGKTEPVTIHFNVE